jgi:hypothetical protein
MSEQNNITEEQLVEILKSLPEEKRQEFLHDVAELMKLNVAYLEKAKSLGIL